MTDPKDIPGVTAFTEGVATANKTLQTFATEMQKASKDTMEQTAELVEKLRGAKTMDEIVAIQTSFMQQSLTSYADVTRRFSELMLAVPMDFAKQGRTAFQQGVDAMKAAASKTGE